MIKRRTFGIKRKERKIVSKASKRPVDKSNQAPKPLSLKKADKAFSRQILARDIHCQYPGCFSTKRLTCSHYHGRAIKSVRFDPENCVALCLFHHFLSKDLGFEFQKQRKENPKHRYDGQYTIFMKKRLGRARFAALDKRAKLSVKPNAAIQQFQSKLQSTIHTLTLANT